MKIVLTGSLGHVGQPLTQTLAQNHAVTVISSSADRRAEIEALGATAAIGSVQDADFLTATFQDADAVFVMVPPNFKAPDPRAYYQQLGRNYAQAIEATRVKRVVHLSSWGAHLAEGTGFILGSHDIEQQLNALPDDVAVTHLRPGYFYYNLNNYLGLIKNQGIIGANYGGEDKLVLVHPTDIAAVAAEELARPNAGRSVRYVASDERTPNEVARVLGAALGKPELKWVTFTDEQVQQSLEKRGVPAHIAALSVDLGDSIHSGKLGEDYELHKPAKMGQIKLEDFAREFAEAYKKA